MSSWHLLQAHVRLLLLSLWDSIQINTEDEVSCIYKDDNICDSF